MSIPTNPIWRLELGKRSVFPFSTKKINLQLYPIALT